MYIEVPYKNARQKQISMTNPLIISKYTIAKPSTMRKFVTQLDKTGALLPAILLEGCVTTGRTYQAYQRDGFVEARERVTEESLAAVFWLFGAIMFGKLFSKIGEKFMKIPKNMPDVGRDNVRTPFNNFIADKAKSLNLSPEKKEALAKYLSKFSVGKTFASILTACAFIGIVVPKLNQAITRHLYGKMKKNDPEHTKAPDPLKEKLTLKDARSIFSAKDVSINAVENFKARKDYAHGSNPSFKASVDSLLRFVHNLETNDVYKLLSTDTGIVTGRTTNARNDDERVEILFRDLTSSFFYCLSMPLIVAFMNRKDTFKGLNTKLNPMSAMDVHNALLEKMGAANINPEVKTDVNKFKKFALGEKYDEQLMEKFLGKKPEPTVKKYFFGLFSKKQEPESRIINLEDFIAKVDKHIPAEKQSGIKDLAQRMSSLMQPAKEGQRILTEAQVEDILRGGAVREPEFMSKILNNMFKSKSDKSPLTNPYRFISQSTIDEKRKQILNYVESIVEDAQANGGVTGERMLKMNKRNMSKNGLFMALGMGISAAFLSTIIPKLQYYITYLRTGKNEFPGTEDMKK